MQQNQNNIWTLRKNKTEQSTKNNNRKPVSGDRNLRIFI